MKNRTRQRLISLAAMLCVLIGNRMQLNTWEGIASLLFEALMGGCLGIGISMLVLSLLPEATHAKFVEWKKKHLFKF